MKFEIYTASDIFKRKKPCDKAILDDDVWVIEINNLQDVLNLMEEEGDIILYQRREGDKYHEICIYDGYVE